MKIIIENNLKFVAFDKEEFIGILDALRETREALSDWEFGTRTFYRLEEFTNFYRNAFEIYEREFDKKAK